MRVYCPPCRAHWSIQLDAIPRGDCLEVTCPRCEALIATTEAIRTAGWVEIMIPAPGGEPDRYPLLGEFTIGRDPGNALQLLSGKISRRHANIVCEEGRYYLEDLGSLNGTFLGHEKISSVRPLHHFDEITIGEYCLRFNCPGQGMATLATPSEEDVTAEHITAEHVTAFDNTLPSPTVPRDRSWGNTTPPPGDPPPRSGETTTPPPVAPPPAVVPAPPAPGDHDMASSITESNGGDSLGNPTPPPRPPPSTPAALLATQRMPAHPFRDLTPSPDLPETQAPSEPVVAAEPVATSDPPSDPPPGTPPIVMAEFPADRSSIIENTPRRQLTQPEASSSAADPEKIRLSFALAHALRRHETLAGLLERSLEFLFEVFELSRGAIFLLEGDRPELKTVRYAPGVPRDPRFPRELLEQVASEHEAILVRTTPVTDSNPPDMDSLRGSAMTVPLLQGDQLSGLVHLDAPHDSETAFSLPDLELFSALAAQVAVGVGDTLRRESMTRKETRRREFGRYLDEGTIERLLEDEISWEREAGSRSVTILFCEIRGFQTLLDSQLPVDATGLLDEFLELMMDIVLKHGGMVNRYLGGGLQATWGFLEPDREGAFRAVQAALEMQTEIEHLNHRRHFRGAPPLSVGIGIDSGTVLTGIIGSPKRREPVCLGPHVDLAREICRVSEGKHVIASDDTFALIRRRIRVQSHPSITPGPGGKPVRLHQILGAFTPEHPGAERRSAHRMKVAINVMWSRTDSDTTLAGMIEDISATGCALQIQLDRENAFQFDDLMILDFSTDEGQEVQGLVARIVAIQYMCNARSDVYYNLKLHFAQVGPEQRVVLKSITRKQEPRSSSHETE